MILGFHANPLQGSEHASSNNKLLQTSKAKAKLNGTSDLSPNRKQNPLGFVWDGWGLKEMAHQTAVITQNPLVELRVSPSSKLDPVLGGEILHVTWDLKMEVSLSSKGRKYQDAGISGIMRTCVQSWSLSFFKPLPVVDMI